MKGELRHGETVNPDRIFFGPQFSGATAGEMAGPHASGAWEFDREVQFRSPRLTAHCERLARQSHLELGAGVRSEASQLSSLSTIGTTPDNLFPAIIGAHGRL
jgi:hypothetical protein